MSRPLLGHFGSRLGQAFRARPLSGGPGSEWTLEACRALPVPGLAELEGKDCFELLFRRPAGDRSGQGTYELVAADGFTTVLFAVPEAAGRMVVTVN